MHAIRSRHRISRTERASTMWCAWVSSNLPKRRAHRNYRIRRFSHWGFGWRPDASALRTFILARSERDLTIPTEMSRTHGVSAALRFLTSCRESTSRFSTESGLNRTPQGVTQFLPVDPFASTLFYLPVRL